MTVPPGQHQPVPVPGPSIWKIVAFVLAGVVVVVGLAVLAFVIFVFVAFSSYGSNK